MHVCQRCGDPSTRRCSGCSTSTAWYCSKACQKTHWVVHIFECNPRREITTADYLALAVYRYVPPDDRETLRDYGFDNASILDEAYNLLELYALLMETLGVSAKQLHSWRTSGNLLQGIEDAFSRKPEEMQSDEYSWFSQNQWLLDETSDQPLSWTALMSTRVDDYLAFRNRALLYAGIRDSELDVHMYAHLVNRTGVFAGWSENRAQCLILCFSVFSNTIPGRVAPSWMTFGFCACPWKPITNPYRDDRPEAFLSLMYHTLLNRCTFDEFFAAYESSSLLSLFQSHDLHPHHYLPHVEDVLRKSPKEFKTIWHLKQAVSGDRLEGPKDTSTTLASDYGFLNCKDHAEIMELKEIYRTFFMNAVINPLALHEAAMRGRIFEHVSLSVPLPKKMKRIMKNPYTPS